MGWGDAFNKAWNQATESAKQAAAAVATGARWIGKQSKAAYDWSKEKVIQGYEWVKQQTKRALDAAKVAIRDTVRNISDTVSDGLVKVHDAIADIVTRAKNAYRKVRSWFTDKRPDSPVMKCQGKGKDAEPDGSLMAPGKKGCTTFGPDATLETARKQSVLSESPCCQKQRTAGKPTRDILYVNGIDTDRATNCKTLHAIAEQTCARVVGIYNATEGIHKDLVQTGQDRLLIKAANEGKDPLTQDGRNKAVDTLSRHIVNEIDAGRQPEIWAYSQGGAVTSLALYDAQYTLDHESTGTETLAGVKVTSMGSAAPFWPDGPHYEHYVHVNDLTPSSFGLGHRGQEDAQRAGRDAHVIRFSGDPKSPMPFNDRHPELDWFPKFTANHDVEDSYLRMRRQRNGGCP